MANPSPKQTSDRLRQIATGIENSKSPDPAKVAQAIREIVSALTPPASAPKKNITPKQAAESLRKIASGIEKAQSPDPAKVAQHIKALLDQIQPSK
jgi:hypothetical protein